MTALVSLVSSSLLVLSSLEAVELLSRVVSEPCILLTSSEISIKEFLSLPISSSFSIKILQCIFSMLEHITI